jgi:hypothetical protein
MLSIPLALALIILLASSARSSSSNIVDTGHILFLWFKGTALCYCRAVQGGIVAEVPGGSDFDFDILCSARCEPRWRGWLRSEVAVSESAGYSAGWVTGTCASAGTDVL